MRLVQILFVSNVTQITGSLRKFFKPADARMKLFYEEIFRSLESNDEVEILKWIF